MRPSAGGAARGGTVDTWLLNCPAKGPAGDAWNHVINSESNGKSPTEDFSETGASACTLFTIRAVNQIHSGVGMKFSRLTALAWVAVFCFLICGCGDTFRPVATPL